MSDNCTAELINPTEALVKGPKALWQWREDNRLAVPGAEFTPQFKRGRWDGTYAPGQWCHEINKDTWEMRCSRGLLGRLSETFNLTITGDGREDFSRRLQFHIEAWSNGQPHLQDLRDYQQEALTLALSEQWGRIALATNAGKGAVIALLADFAQHINTPAIILCDEISVFDALEGEIARWTNIVLGRVSGGAKAIPNESVVLAMVPTLHRRLNRKNPKAHEWRAWLNSCGMLLLDEADKATAPSWRWVLSNAKKSHWRIGFSGTFPNPQEKPYDDLRLDELIGPILIRAKNIDLVEQRISAAPLVELHSYNITKGAAQRMRKWWEYAAPARRLWVYEQAFVFNLERHEFIRTLIRPDTATAIVINRVVHGEQLAEVIAGSVFIDGSCSPQHRRQALDAFARGDIKVLIVTKILDRGTNRLGHTSDLIFASGEGSTRQTLQRIGRGLRRTGGKEFLRLVDIIDHVAIDEDSKDKWLKMAARFVHTAGRKRVRLYRDEGFEVKIV